MLKYRSDIDGLRAIAVLSVILFHVHSGTLHGGFAGVDIFFVLSGFLITSLLVKDLREGHFSLAEFYERRARRILPALTTVCLATLGALYLIFFPADYIELGRSAIAAMFSISNIFFWKTIDYFATASNEKPLLHTWSLGVEEQFYVIFPLLLWGLYKYLNEKTIILAIAFLSLISLGVAEYGVHTNQPFAFYMLPARFWELGFGALLAFAPIAKFYSRTNNYLSSTGFLLLAAGLGFSHDKSFPGIAALVPCLGAGLLLLAGPDTMIAEKILARRPVVLIGKMSYSLYLWHWPLLAAARYLFEDMHLPHYAAIMVATFAISYLSWRFIETPLRNRQFLTRREIFVSSLAAIVTITILSCAIICMKGLPQRFSSRAFEIAEAANNHAPLLYNVCMTDEFKNNPDCYLGDKGAAKTSAILWGDSHAAAIQPLVSDLLAEKHLKGMLMARTSCPGLIGAYKWGNEEFDACHKNNESVLDYILAHKDIKYIFLAARWAPIADKVEFEDSKEDAFYRALNHTAEILKLNGRIVLFIASVPEIDFSVPRCLSHKAAFPAFADCTPPTIDAYMKRQKQTLAAFSALEEDNPVFYPYKTLCKSGICQIGDGDKILYFDDDHVGIDGALYMVKDARFVFSPYLKAGQ